MADTGLEALTSSVRQVLLADSVLAAKGLYYGRAQREGEMPYVVYSFVPMRVHRHLGRTEVMRMFRGQFRICTDEVRGMATAKPLKDALFTRLNEAVGGLMPEDRLNVFLEPLGWQSMIVLEVAGGELAPYLDYVGKDRDVARYNTGVQFDFRIQRI